MSRSKAELPLMRDHTRRKQHYVRIDGRQIYLGPIGSEQAKAKYLRVLGEWQANGCRLPPRYDHRSAFTIADLVAEYWRRRVTVRYVKHGKPTGEQDNVRLALRPLVELFADVPPEEFSPRDLEAYRQHLIERGALQPRRLCRNTINQRVGIIRRMFRWGVSAEIVSPTTYERLRAVEQLRAAETAAPEADRRSPVTPAQIEATREHLSPPVRRMVDIQLVTGMRPGEVVLMRWCDIEREGKPWIYYPGRHKTQHCDPSKAVPLNQRARHVLAEVEGADPEDYLFTPREADAWKREQFARERKTPVQPSQRKRAARARRHPKRKLGDHYSSQSYGRAIARACKRAGVPHWSPGALRHFVLTRVTVEHGLQVAQALAGHTEPRTTMRYVRKGLLDVMKALETFE